MCGGAVNEATINHWYALLQETIDKYKIERDLIFAMDETCCFLDKCTHKTRHIGPRRLQQQLTLQNENRETATLIPIICADGSPKANCNFQREAAPRERPILKPSKCFVCMLISHSIVNLHVYRLRCTERAI